MDVLGHLSDEWKKNKGKHKFRRAVGYVTENKETTIRAAEFLGRDRNPLSSYDDDNPEVTFRQTRSWWNFGYWKPRSIGPREALGCLGS